MNPRFHVDDTAQITLLAETSLTGTPRRIASWLTGSRATDVRPCEGEG